MNGVLALLGLALDEVLDVGVADEACVGEVGGVVVELEGGNGRRWGGLGVQAGLGAFVATGAGQQAGKEKGSDVGQVGFHGEGLVG